MDIGPSRRIVQGILAESLSRIRKFGTLNDSDFVTNVQDLPAKLRQWADQLEDPSDVTPRPEIPDLGGYALWAEHYDNLAGNPVVAGEEEIIEELMGDVKGLKVLDVGCGTGRHAIPLAQKGAEVVGFEPTLEMLEKAKEKTRAQNLHLDLRHGFIDDLDPNLGPFDLVVCCLVLSHVQNLDAAIQKIASRVAPGGRLIITDFHPTNILIGFRTSLVSNEQKYVVPNFLHPPSKYFQALRNQGLNVTAFHERGSDPNLPGLPMALIMIAEKSSPA
ncbi:MAG: class I SAM-dependent methyltransferase [bacterium]|nr:class I SAM-dependent methyltransferase [bacterium]